MSEEGKAFRAVDWRDGRVILVDQTRLPAEEVYLELSDWREVGAAIKTMQVRGAPAIGIAAEPHFDTGKHVYWRALTKTGRRQAEALGLRSCAYPKPDTLTMAS